MRGTHPRWRSPQGTGRSCSRWWKRSGCPITGANPALPEPCAEPPAPGDTRYRVPPQPQSGLEKPEKHRGSQRSSRHPREWETWLVQPVPGTGGHHIMAAVSSPRHQQNGAEPPIATNNLRCLATTTATISTTPAPPTDNRNSTKAMGRRSEESPLSPGPYNPRGDPDSITKKLLLPCTAWPQPEPSHGGWLGPGGPLLAACFPLRLPSVKAELQGQR